MDILVVDDDRISALKLRSLLERLGHGVAVTRDGVEGWGQIGERAPGLVISDWMMPGMDGPELCRRIRARRAGAYIYVILLTSRDGQQDRVAGLEAGADDFLVKPLDPAELLARLNVARRILSMEEQLRAQADRLREMHAALEGHNARLTELATTDGLTGLANHRHFREALASALSPAARRGSPLSLVMLDVDRFKAYNDAFGHPAGDDVLRAVGALLHACARPGDVVARYGGEEFAALLPQAGEEAALAFVARLRQAIAGHAWPLAPITVSLGVATSAAETDDGACLIGLADRALYHAKRSGRDRVTHARDLPTGIEAIAMS